MYVSENGDGDSHAARTCRSCWPATRVASRPDAWSPPPTSRPAPCTPRSSTLRLRRVELRLAGPAITGNLIAAPSESSRRSSSAAARERARRITANQLVERAQRRGAIAGAGRVRRSAKRLFSSARVEAGGSALCPTRLACGGAGGGYGYVARPGAATPRPRPARHGPGQPAGQWAPVRITSSRRSRERPPSPLRP